MASAEHEMAEPTAHPHTPNEREQEALGILYEEGWTVGELAMVFEVRRETVCNYIDELGVER